MAYASIAGHARTSATSPRAHATCDRCGWRVNYVDLRPQMQWGGASLINLKILVCKRCYDTPQAQLRSIIIPADPVPIVNPRPQDFIDAESDYLTLTPGTVDLLTNLPIPNTTMMSTQGGLGMTKIPVGRPQVSIGLNQNAIMPFFDKAIFRVRIPAISARGDGTPVVAVTCSAAHGLATGAQISVEGLSNGKACGFYNATVATATAFSYTVQAAIPSGPLMTNSTIMLTANVGIPRNYTSIPSTGL